MKQKNKFSITQPSHTKEPWMIVGNGVDDKYKYSIVSIENGAKAVCDIYRHNYPARKDAADPKAKADSKLLVNAPRLLKESIQEYKLIEDILTGASMLTPIDKHSLEAILADKRKLLKKIL